MPSALPQNWHLTRGRRKATIIRIAKLRKLGATLKDVGQVVGLSVSRVRQIECKLLRCCRVVKRGLEAEDINGILKHDYPEGDILYIQIILQHRELFMDEPISLEQKVMNMLDAFERLDVEMHNHQIRVNNALKGILERIEIYEQRNINNQNNNSSTESAIQGGLTLAHFS